jgi:hypothetical protein
VDGERVPSKAVAHSMQREIGAMRVLKAAKRWHYVNAKSRSREFAELGTCAHGPIVGNQGGRASNALLNLDG